MTIKVVYAGEDTGGCRKYYNNIENGRLYAHQQQDKNSWQWYTTCNGEPDMPFSDRVEVEIIER